MNGIEGAKRINTNYGMPVFSRIELRDIAIAVAVLTASFTIIFCRRKVFSDDRFSYYRVKFKPCQDASISSNQWLCGAGYTPVDTTLSPGEYHFDDEEDEEEQQDYYDEAPEADGNEE